MASATSFARLIKMAQSFRTRLTIWNIATLTFAMLLLGGLLTFATQKLTLQSIDNDLVARVEGIQEEFRNGRPGAALRANAPNSPGLGVGDPGQGSGGPGPRGPFDRFRQPPIPPELDEESRDLILIRRPRFINREGEVILDAAVSEPWDRLAFDASLKGQTVLRTIRYKDSDLRIVSAPLQGRDQLVGVVQFASDLAPVAAIQSSQILVLAILIPATLLLASIGAAFLTRRALKPIEDLTAAARNLGANNLAQRIPTQGDDEFAQLADEFNGMIARLETSFAEKENLLKAQKQFTADASHELRTPLTRIKIITSSTQEDEAIDADTRERFGTIQTAADHMAALVDQMLTLARTENLKENPNLEPYSLTAVIASAVQLANLDRDPRLKLELKDKRALVNPPLLERAILNLLTNAARHTPETGTIALSTEEQNGLIAIKVADTGEGIPAEHLANITRRFYRVDSARNQATGGTGLGLSIVESIVAAHGGSLKIQSESGKGTTATLTVKKA